MVKVEVIFKSSGAVSYLRYLRCLSRKRDDDLYIGGGDNDPDKPVGTVRSTDKSVYVPSGVKQAVGCLQDMYGGSGGNKKLVCGMKNVYLDKVAAAARGTCNQGDSIIVDIKASLMFKVGRYDVGWYIATDGGDALKGSCVVSILEQGKRYNVVSAPGEVRPVGKVAWDNDALPIALNKNDACGDVFIDGGSGAIDMNNLVISQNVTCVDKNDDGNLDFGICFTFRTNLNDGKCDPAAPIPGDAQTCYCARYDVPQISVVKPDSIAAKC